MTARDLVAEVEQELAAAQAARDRLSYPRYAGVDRSRVPAEKAIVDRQIRDLQQLLEEARRA